MSPKQTIATVLNATAAPGDITIEETPNNGIYVDWRGHLFLRSLPGENGWTIATPGARQHDIQPLTPFGVAAAAHQGLLSLLFNAKPEELPALQAFCHALHVAGRRLHV